MNAKKRYALVLMTVAFLAFCYYGGHRLKDKSSIRWKTTLPRLKRHDTSIPQIRGESPSKSSISVTPSIAPFSSNNCRMSTCFNLTRCQNRPFRVFVYPPDEHLTPSDSYNKILNTLMESHYVTSKADEACLFVMSLDTLDRDPLSSFDFVHNMPARLAKLEHWNNGENHVIFNLYSGTYPNYTEDLHFDVGKAILAKASISEDHYRSGFDVSIPLFHKIHPERGGEPGRVSGLKFAKRQKYFLAFKGKRYVYGIGSDTRNSLYHLHNGKNLVLVTTCRHGKNWRDLKDDRCDEDNQEFDKWDYDDLLANSTFCLVPRGRRLGSYRFIETLQAGCIPVVLSNGWRLPFAEVIDWSQAAIQADERLLFQVPELLHSLPAEKVFSMQQQTQFLWDRYLSSVEKIVHTTLEIIRERVHPEKSREGIIWNSDPGALLMRNNFSGNLKDFPFKLPECPPDGVSSLLGRNCHQKMSTRDPLGLNFSSSLDAATSGDDNEKFSAVIFTQSSMPTIQMSAPIFKLVRNVAASKYVDKILVYWTLAVSPPPLAHWPGVQASKVALHVILAYSNSTSPSIRFRLDPLLLFPNSNSSAILSLDDDVDLLTDEIDFAFSVWRQFPERIVGFPARNHFWDNQRSMWSYMSRMTNEYSLVLTSAAFLHRYYFYLYTEYLSPHFLRTVSQLHNCEDILMNFLVSHVTRRPPIKVTQRKQYKAMASPSSAVKSPWSDPSHFSQRQTCLNTFVAGFGYNPLIKSSVRFDPVLYKDSVSSVRKKYRKLESLNLASGSN